VNFIVPVDMSDARQTLSSNRGNAVSPPVQVAVRTLQPGIFVVDPLRWWERYARRYRG
jgi:uncharacterized protein (TIGR03437 family)